MADSNQYPAKVAAMLTSNSSLTSYTQRLSYFIKKIDRENTRETPGSKMDAVIPQVIEKLFTHATTMEVSHDIVGSEEDQYRAINAIQGLANSCTPATQEKVRVMCEQSWEIGQKNPYVLGHSDPAGFLGHEAKNGSTFMPRRIKSIYEPAA